MSLNASPNTVWRKPIAAQDHDLSLNRYKEATHVQVDHRRPKEILATMELLESEIGLGIRELKGLIQ